MKRLENYILTMGYHPDTIRCAIGDVYGHDDFIDGASIQTSKVVEHTDEYIKTLTGSIYYLGEPHPAQIDPAYSERNYDLYLLRKGSDAIHKTGNISRDVFDAELIVVNSEEDGYYIGHFAEGYGFFGIKFKKEDCRKATLDELLMCDEGRMEDIVF